jgi:biopolymer transport protein ExbD
MPSLPSPRGKTRPRLESIPFIDIMFFLLATFMMVSLSMIKNEGVPVNLPSAVTSAAEERKSSTIITVTESGDIYLDKEALSLEALKKELKKLKTENPDLKVFINGDEKADFGRGIEVLDEVRSTGIKKVAIQTKRKQS